MSEVKQTATYVIVAIVEAPASATIMNDALIGGIVSAFEPYHPFRCHSLDIMRRDPED